MRDFERIDELIREARVQRSAYIGQVLGEWLGEAWLWTARAASGLGEYLSGRPELPPHIEPRG